MQELHLTDLIDVKILQKMQDSLSNFTGMAALTTDERGVPVTVGSNFTRLCMDMTRQSEVGCRRCEECDKRGAMLTLAEGKPSVYDCHAGLIDFAAPIMVDGSMVGSFIGGQVRVAPMDEKATRRVAAELGLDEDAYVEEARNIRLLDREEVEKAAAFLTNMASILSEVALHNYRALQKSRSLERVAQAQNALIINMNADLQKTMLDLDQWGRRALEGQDPREMADTLQQFMEASEDMSASIQNTVEYARMSEGDISLQEEIYGLSQLLEGVQQENASLLIEHACQLLIEIDSQVPDQLYGDQGKLRQLLGRLVQYVAEEAGEGTVWMRADCRKTTYALELRIRLQYGQSLSEEETESRNRSLSSRVLRLTQEVPGEKMGLVFSGYLVQRMSGRISVRSSLEEGTVYELEIPQLYIG